MDKIIRYNRIADFIRFLHFLWILVMLGNLIFLFVMPPTIMAISWVIIIVTGGFQLIWGGCPLTLMENYYRRQANPDLDTYEPFFAALIQKHFHITIPAWVVSIQLVIMLAVAITIVHFVFA